MGDAVHTKLSKSWDTAPSDKRTVAGEKIVEELHASGDVVWCWMDLAKVCFFLLYSRFKVGVRHNESLWRNSSSVARSNTAENEKAERSQCTGESSCKARRPLSARSRVTWRREST